MKRAAYGNGSGGLHKHNASREMVLRETREDEVGIKRPVFMKLDAETYREFKRKVYDMGLTVTEVFEEFAQMVVIGDDIVEHVLKSLAQRNAHECVDEGSEKFANHKRRIEALFDYIAGQEPVVEIVDEDYK